ncbi:hypothetical protein C0Q70_16822 [Pomacea canaliculata]|uniref:Uncharacterized protein n=1 Tax=Pomacea canaliculata TaxID=400727 RepID=A0A2T7NQV3_POMCA|nr:hypothetical protein C0Q70_16822 [Pomacea canaliculata]
MDEREDDSEYDSDTELQRAYADGRLKAGLNIEARPPRSFINNVAGMKQKLEEFQRTDLSWFERLDVTAAPISSASEEVVDVEDEFKRELLFYRQAQAAVLIALPKLSQLGLSTKRPEDYFAEMAKSDSHMVKVRAKLQERQQALERSLKAKKLRELKKYGKKVQQEVLQKRQKEKREMLDAVKKYRKGKIEKLDFLNDINEKKTKSAQPKANKRRDWKNQKFGFGGQKKRSKRNTKESTSSSTSSMKKKDNVTGDQFIV